MILDLIILAVTAVGQVCLIALELIVNLVIFLVEVIVRLAWPDKNFGRLHFRRDEEEDRGGARPVSPMVSGIAVLVILLVFGGSFAIEKLRTRTVEVVAVDGIAAPFALFEVERKEGVETRRSDGEGILDLPRFGVGEVRVNDPRYVKARWEGSTMPGRLELERSLMGKSLDYVLEKIGE